MTATSFSDTQTASKSDREFWHRLLIGGGNTSLPRFSRKPRAGVAQGKAAVSDELVAALQHLAAALSVPLGSLFLTAYARVLATLSGEHLVVLGYIPAYGGSPLPLRLSTAPESWRALVVETHRAELELLARADFAVDDLRRELGLGEPSFEAVFDSRADASGALCERALLQAGFVPSEGLVFRYRTEALDAGCAARIAGYQLAALDSIAADPDTDPTKQSLLSAEELGFQLDGLAGPRRRLPDRRLHELFETQARTSPGASAAVHGDKRWTYRELNDRANQLARALRARGLSSEGVVCVVCERNLNWLAAVLAIFKAGGTYLPIEPHFPADRIATTLSRAGCQLVLTEAESSAPLEQALGSLPEVKRLFIDAACNEGHATGDLGISVAADQLAYIYFTSGSTGEPKGAMCEHSGMLNHVCAKISALGIAAGDVVAQTAPQCFDISLWQLVSALLVGGETLLVAQDEILDAGRFLDNLASRRVSVVQVVPSYLEVLVSCLEQHPRHLSDLRCVSVTGEALKKELVERWFAVQPQVKLLNAYGLTETSDDTNHEVMDAVPDTDRVPLGRPIQNVCAYVVDEQLSPVPLGAPGELVFSGICVGRGYVNDLERTREAFMLDPHREGRRLYRSGDYGRWLPDGKLEFLGRRDSQVKVRGFRIEITEIENVLLRVQGVRDGAVVVLERADHTKQLVAFYSAERPLEVEGLRRCLSESLPPYMLPAAFHWQRNLALTENGKIDKKALSALANDLDVTGRDHDRPTTATEKRLATAWAKVLGVASDQVGRRDHFFDLGGTSLAALKLIIALDRAVTLNDLNACPVLFDLAALIDGKADRRSGLLQPLSDVSHGPALVCFPYAGGNAVNFRSLASALQASGIAVHAVELPGHDLARDDEPLAPLERVAEQVASEIAQLGPTEILLWGHSSGVAFALETARNLDELGVAVTRVFLGAQLLDPASERRAAIGKLERQSNAEIAERLVQHTGYTEFGELDTQRAEHIGAAYRHDFFEANRYLADSLDHPPALKLSVPVTVVVARDDPTTQDPDRYRDWELLAERVEVCELSGGGHYFLRTRPGEAATAILNAANLSTVER